MVQKSSKRPYYLSGDRNKTDPNLIILFANANELSDAFCELPFSLKEVAATCFSFELFVRCELPQAINNVTIECRNSLLS